MEIEELKDVIYIVTEKEKSRMAAYKTNTMTEQGNGVINTIYDVVSILLTYPAVIDGINKLIGKEVISNPLLSLKRIANKEVAKHLEKNIEILNSKISFITRDEYDELKSCTDKITFVMNDTPQIGSIFIKDNYVKDIIYRDSYNYEIECYRNQISLINNILTNLGATSIKGTVHLQESKDLGINGNVKLTKADLKANAEYKQEFNNSISQELEVSITNTGNYTKESYEKALDIAKKCNLDHIVEIKELLENRNPDNAMKHNSENFDIKLNSNWNNMVEVGAGLEKSGFKIPINFKVNVNKSFTKSLHYDIKF